MRNTRVAGPSGAPKSTPAGTRPTARLGTVTCSDRACGRPTPPGMPVAICASRAATSARKPSASVTRPGRLQRLGELPGGVAPVRGDEVEDDQLRGDERVCHDASVLHWWEGIGIGDDADGVPRSMLLGAGNGCAGQQDRGAPPGDRAGERLARASRPL